MLHLVGCLYYCINDAQSHKHQTYREKLQDTCVLIIVMKATYSNMSEECLLDQLFRSISLRFCWSVLKPTFLARSQNCESEYHLHHVCPSVRMEQLGFHWADFYKILYLRIFRKFIEKIRVPLKSVKENAHFTWSPVYIFLILSRSILRGMRKFSNKSCRYNQNTNFMFKKYFRKLYIYTLRMCNTFAFPMQLWLHQRPSVLCCTYIACLVAITIKYINFDYWFCSLTFFRSRRRNFYFIYTNLSVSFYNVTLNGTSSITLKVIMCF